MKQVLCPSHNIQMTLCKTTFGQRWACSKNGCSVVWWGKPNTTPADDMTRRARIDTHAVFDRLWKHKVISRSDLYQRMQYEIGLAHIGLCDVNECLIIQGWVHKIRRAQACCQA